MRPKKDKIVITKPFDKYRDKPFFWAPLPKEFLDKEVITHKTENSINLKELPTLVSMPDLFTGNYDINFRVDHDGGTDYYNCDYSIEVKVTTPIPNPNYEKELADYNKKKEQFEKEYKAYQVLLDEFEKVEKEKENKRQEEWDKKEFNRLKKKYGSSKTNS